MLVDRNIFAQQMVARYNAIKKDLIAILKDPGETKKTENPNTEGKPLKTVLQKMRISETELRNTLKNTSGEPIIEIYAITKKENDKEEQWIRIITKTVA